MCYFTNIVNLALGLCVLLWCFLGYDGLCAGLWLVTLVLHITPFKYKALSHIKTHNYRCHPMHFCCFLLFLLSFLSVSFFFVCFLSFFGGTATIVFIIM